MLPLHRMSFRLALLGALYVAALLSVSAAPNAALQALADKGDPAAQFALAMRYLEGRDGVEEDVPTAVKWATRSAEQGHGPACELLGQYFISDENNQRDTGKAAHFLKKALQANPESMTAKAVLGLLYHQGNGMPLDPDQGLRLIQEAAAANDGVGLALAAELKKRGHLNGILPQTAPAANLVKRAEDGDPEAQYDLSVAYLNGWIESPPGTNPSKMWRERAAESGSARAQFEIGRGYQGGYFGYAKDASRALLWLKRAAEGDLGEAQLAVGTMYFKGEGVAKDEKLAIEYLRKAVINNQKPAEALYGILLVRGFGGVGTDDEALRLLRTAEKRGDATAREFMTESFMEEKYGPADADEMVRLLRFAIKKGNNRAKEVLGMRLYTGDQVKQDVEAARPLLIEAAEGGSALAVRALFDYISKRGSKLGNSAMDSHEKQFLYGLHQRMTVLYGLNGESADRLIAAKSISGFKPQDPKAGFLSTGTREAIALLRIYESEGGRDREALQWLGEAEKQVANQNALDELVKEYRAKMAQRNK